MTNRPDFVANYATAGFPLFPLNGKTPTVKEWQKTPPNDKLTKIDLPGNYGVVLPDTILVIDVDVKKGAPGIASFEKLNKDLGFKSDWFKDTFVVKTGTGGIHIYLTKNSELKIKKNVKEYPGIDFLSKGHFVVGAGSVHPDTKVEYLCVSDSTPGDVRPAPQQLDAILVKSEVITTDVKKGFTDDSGPTIAQYIELMNDMPAAIEGNRRNSTYIVVCRGHDLGLSEAKCAEVIAANYNPRSVPPLNEQELIQTVKDGYKYAKGKAGNANVAAIFDVVENVQDDYGINSVNKTPKGVIKPDLNNAVHYLQTNPALSSLFRYNTFAGAIEISEKAPWYENRGHRGARISDEDIILLKFFLIKHHQIEFRQEIVMEAIVVMAFRRHYHPVRNYLNSLKWDKTPRLDTWLIKCGAVDNVYTRAVARKTLCAAVRRVFQPGCKWDYILILEGPQGIGKSTICRILGRLWGADMNLDPHAKDSVHMMLGKWIIELSEMVALKWAEASALKSFITRETDTVRLSFARHAKDFPRQSIFIGTCNPEHVGYLADTTGNRRFWIVNLPHKISLVEFENDCEQILAEAVQYYRSETLYLTGDAEKIHGYEAMARVPEEPMQRHVSKYLTENPEINEVQIMDLLEYCGVAAKSVTKLDQSRIAQSLVGLKWVKNTKVVDGTVQIFYTRPRSEQIERLIDEL